MAFCVLKNQNNEKVFNEIESKITQYAIPKTFKKIDEKKDQILIINNNNNKNYCYKNNFEKLLIKIKDNNNKGITVQFNYIFIFIIFILIFIN